MKNFRFKVVTLLIMIIAFSCDEPVTVVTNIVHTDGSVTRKIEMRGPKNNFGEFGPQVPFDSSWVIKDSCEVGIKGDTIWIRRAEKLFRNVEEINATYKNDTSSNAKYPRHATFSRNFRWFNTSYRFAEIVDKRIPSGSSIRNFLNDEELYYYYSSDDMKNSSLHGPDSLKYKMLSDTIDKKYMNWIVKNYAILWVQEFSKLTTAKAGAELSARLPGKLEDKFIEVINQNQEKFDSLWSAGVLSKKILGEEDGVKFKTEADSALTAATNMLLADYKIYSVHIVMPGKLIRTNGYIDSARRLFWPVNPDLFFCDTYEMWAESRTPNIWAWVVSGIFLLFVVTGIVLKRKK